MCKEYNDQCIKTDKYQKERHELARDVLKEYYL